MMFSDTPAQWGQALRWIHVASFFGISGSVLFVHLYLGSGKRWLAALTIGLRFLTLVPNFASHPNIAAVPGKSTANPKPWRHDDPTVYKSRTVI